MKRVTMLGSVAAIAVALAAPASAQFSNALGEARTTANEARASQQRIDQLDDQTASLLNDYRANLKQLEAARRYNASLERNISAQQLRITRIQTDLENVAGLQRAMQPLMEDMVATLEQIVSADIPFDLADRQARVARLKGVMENPDITAAQRYRLIVEAYQIENEFGRTIAAYEGTIDGDQGEVSGEFLRIGRVSLVFKTPDDSVLRIWNPDAGAWENLNKSYLPDIKLGLRMAKEMTAPDLLPVPVKPPVAAE